MVVGALAIVATSFFATLWYLDRNASTCTPGRVVTLHRPFGKMGAEGVGYVKDIAGIVDIPGDDAASTRSRLVLCEDGNLIGPAHSLHADIVKEGGGRYSHWGNSLIFSTSDNSNPNRNGRVYVAVEPR